MANTYIGWGVGKTPTGQGVSMQRQWYSTPKAATTPAPTTKDKTGGTTGKTGGTTGGTKTSISDLLKTYQSDISKQRADEEARNKALQEQARAGISSSYQPIYSELDRQIGLLPTQRQELEGRIGELTAQQRQAAELERQRGIASLEGSAAQQQGLAQSSIRNLEGDIRNQLESAGRYLGTAGAGDSSAAVMASEAITKAGLKGRGDILSTRNAALNEIEMKKQDVNNLTAQELNKIEQFKTDRLFTIASDFQERANTLNRELANAKSSEKSAIAQMLFDTQKEYISRLRDLDNQVTNYKTTLNQWQMERQAGLEDYATKLGMSKAYSGPNASDYQQRLSDTVAMMREGWSDQQISQNMNTKYGVNEYTPAIISEARKIRQDEQSSGIEQYLASQGFSTQTQPQTQGTGDTSPTNTGNLNAETF